jgi:hypothetical protein
MKMVKKYKSKDKNTNVAGGEMYEFFAEVARLKELYNADKAAYQKMALEWGVEERKNIKAMLQAYSFRNLGD